MPRPTATTTWIEPGEPCFVAQGLDKIYRTGEVEIAALCNVSIALHDGGLLALLGPSGSGKSTLLNILGGLDRPTAGSVRFRDQELTAANDAALTRFRREHVGFVFQFYNLIASLTAAENVALVTEIARDPMHPRDALAAVGLEARADHFPAQLSGGEQQRVAIARAIAKRPDILLCDEPTGALDSATGVQVLAALEEANRTFGATVALITHNAGIAAMADRVVRMADGRIVEDRRNQTKTPAAALTW